MATTPRKAAPWIARRRRLRLWKIADWAVGAVVFGPMLALLAVGCGNLLLLAYGALFS